MAIPRFGVVAQLTLAAVAASPLLYPLWLTLATRRRTPPIPPRPTDWPSVVAIVPAYKESEIIAEKIEDLRANGYPGLLRVVVVAEDEGTAERARSAGVEVIAPSERLGKAEALNRGVSATHESIVLITDANTILAPGSIAALVRWFEDPDVGAVAGEKRVAAPEQGFYWVLEAWLKRKESLLGSTIGVVGELVAVRRAVYRPMPGDVSADDLWIALDVLEQGRSIRYEPDAVALEEPSSSLRDEWTRRTRTVCAVIDASVRHPGLLFSGHDAAGFQLWGHRLVRYLGAVAHAGLVASALRPRQGTAARAFVLAHVAAAGTLARNAHGQQQAPAGRLTAQVLLMQAAGVVGVLRYLRGDRPARWQKPERSRGQLSGTRMSPSAPEAST